MPPPRGAHVIVRRKRACPILWNLARRCAGFLLTLEQTTMDTSNIRALPCFERTFHGKPDAFVRDFGSIEALHAITEKNAVADFRAKAGTDEMVTDLRHRRA